MGNPIGNPERTAAPQFTIRHCSKSSKIRNFSRQGWFGYRRRSTGKPGRMTQIFSPSADTWLRLFALGGAAALAASLSVWIAFARSDYYTGADIHPPAQPVPFSHQHHAGD